MDYFESRDVKGIDPADKAIVDIMFSKVDKEQDHLPEWFRGFPPNSVPVAMANGLIQELEELTDKPREEAGIAERIKTAHKRLNILSNFHNGHRNLMVTGSNPLAAINVQAECIGSAIEDGIYPFKDYEADEFTAYLGTVIQTYLQFYLPSWSDIPTDY
jgi:hypothetical protein